MSGTSIDSVDYALCEIDERQVRLVELWNADFPKWMQNDLHAAARGELPSWEFSQLHHELGRFYAQHAVRGKKKPTLAGLHGQTVFHNPSKKNPATLQLGEPVYLAAKLGATVINNFRVADMALGGQGAPLATIFHQFVFGEKGKHVCVNNLGGISNVTSLNWSKGAKPSVMAFDTGPANVLIDMAMRHFSSGKKAFDKNGAAAARGKANETLLQGWLRHPYFKQTPPKSTGRELFGEPFFKEIFEKLRTLGDHDAVATLTEFTARSVALNYKLHLPSAPDRVVLAGGGAANPVLVRAIGRALSEAFPKKSVELKTSADLGWPVQAIEPAAFALLAWLRVNGRPGNLPETTGAQRAVLCGQITQV
ncbi:MAG: Anhydro-N-acetylmuramic acid kinase [Verrucomicrobiales bacterium]|nr:Anhydro-N-acetylmuramic acid kinase [Verrucomicrobiales bacterium]